jgi:hypothetical protein
LATHAKAEFDLQDAEIVDSQQTQQAAESPQKIGCALAQVSRLPAPPRVASQTQYSGNGMVGIDKRDYIGADSEKR